jgi:hypothetical protein
MYEIDNLRLRLEALSRELWKTDQGRAEAVDLALREVDKTIVAVGEQDIEQIARKRQIERYITECAQFGHPQRAVGARMALVLLATGMRFLRAHENIESNSGEYTHLQEFFEHEQHRAEQAHLYYQVRVFQEIEQPNLTNTPSYWSPIAYCDSYNDAAIVADAVASYLGCRCQIWSCTPVIDPDIPPASSDPISWRWVGGSK